MTVKAMQINTIGFVGNLFQKMTNLWGKPMGKTETLMRLAGDLDPEPIEGPECRTE